MNSRAVKNRHGEREAAAIKKQRTQEKGKDLSRRKKYKEVLYENHHLEVTDLCNAHLRPCGECGEYLKRFSIAFCSTD